jgi:glutamate synthase domain-containing protein 2
MGISTISSYRNSQLFETIALDPAVCRESFSRMPAKRSAASHSTISCETASLVTLRGFGSPAAEFRDAGLYRFRHNGEQHASSPELVRRMHRYIKSPTEQNRTAFKVLSEDRKENKERLLQFEI